MKKFAFAQMLNVKMNKRFVQQRQIKIISGRPHTNTSASLKTHNHELLSNKILDHSAIAASKLGVLSHYVPLPWCF